MLPEMLYPSNIEEKLGFGKLKQAIRVKCKGEIGQSYVDKIRFSSDFNLIKKLLHLTDEMVKILESDTQFPRSEYYKSV